MPCEQQATAGGGDRGDPGAPLPRGLPVAPSGKRRTREQASVPQHGKVATEGLAATLAHNGTRAPTPPPHSPHAAPLVPARRGSWGSQRRMRTRRPRRAIRAHRRFLRRLGSAAENVFVCWAPDGECGRRSCGKWTSLYERGRRLWTRCRRKREGAETGETERGSGEQ